MRCRCLLLCGAATALGASTHPRERRIENIFSQCNGRALERFVAQNPGLCDSIQQKIDTTNAFCARAQQLLFERQGVKRFFTRAFWSGRTVACAASGLFTASVVAVRISQQLTGWDEQLEQATIAGTGALAITLAEPICRTLKGWCAPCATLFEVGTDLSNAIGDIDLENPDDLLREQVPTMPDLPPAPPDREGPQEA